MKYLPLSKVSHAMPDHSKDIRNQCSYSALLLLLFFIFPDASLRGQITFERHYGGSLDDVGHAIALTSDGGYIQCGFTRSYSAGDYDLYLIGTDPWGDTLWTRSFGNSGYDAGFGITEATGGEFIACGTLFDPDSSIARGYLVRINATGEPVWTVTHPGSTNTTYFDIQPAHNEGYVITGTIEDTSGTGHLVILKIDEAANIIWSRQHARAAASGGNAILTTNDEGYLVCGYADNYSPSFNRNLYLLKTDESGDTTWTRQYGGLAYEMGWDICSHPSGGYVAAGYSTGMGANSGDGYVVKTDLEGNLDWFSLYGQSGLDIIYGIATTVDGHLVATGITAEQGSELQEAWLLNIASDGDSIWSRTFGGERKSCGYAITETMDEGLIICGSTNAYGNGVYDFYLIKTDSIGSIITSAKGPEFSYSVFSVFPNPARDQFHIRLSDNCNTIEIRNMAGVLVCSLDPQNEKEVSISCDSWTRGTYLIYIRHGDLLHIKNLLLY